MPSCDTARFDLAVHLSASFRGDGAPPRAVVAIPARDEDERIEACLAALLTQSASSAADSRFGIVVLANNCRDATAARARGVLHDTQIPHQVLPVELPARFANAGFARGLALDIASLWVESSGEPGALLTTDADTRVGTDWMRRNLDGLAGGCGAVAGRFEFSPGDEAALPAHVRARRRLETAYAATLAALAARLDPLPHDPWPNHATASGASFALTQSAYRHIGGLPAVEVGEDRALSATLTRHDIPIRHDPEIVVVTSARLDGRAQCGCATTLRQWCDAGDAGPDDRLESLPAALARITLRNRLRRDWGAGFRPAEWEARLSLPDGALSAALGERGALRFGQVWATICARAPQLRQRGLPLAQMARHLEVGRQLLDRLEAASERRQQIEPIILRPLLEERAQATPGFGDELFSRFVA